jgi:two-component system chemotaxis sensor kinase CheA
VRTEAIDRFLASVGELMQRQARLETLHRGAPMWERQAEVAEELEGMERVARELRRRALDIRTTPVRRVLERLPRVASELARALGKRVEVQLHGDEVEVDRAVLDHLDDSLLHLVRNAVDHGLEAPAKRTLAGKDQIGKIELTAARVAGRLRLRLQDDGAGVDVEGVRRRAVERGMLPEAVVEDLPAERIADLLFEPGMSTKDEVSAISGRGVGLDAVKRQIEALGGTISLSSQPGQGTTFEIDLPSMVALQRVLVLEVGGERLALPAARVESVVDLDEGTVEGTGGEAFFVWKGEPLPLLDLTRHVLGRPAPPTGRGSVVVLELEGFSHGLLVDRVAADHEVFVREVPAALAHRPALAGVAMLNDGEPVFLLEPGMLVGDLA